MGNLNSNVSTWNVKKTKVFVDKFIDNAKTIDQKQIKRHDKEIGLPWVPKATNHNAAKSEDSKLHILKGET